MCRLRRMFSLILALDELSKEWKRERKKDELVNREKLRFKSNKGRKEISFDRKRKVWIQLNWSSSSLSHKKGRESTKYNFVHLNDHHLLFLHHTLSNSVIFFSSWPQMLDRYCHWDNSMNGDVISYVNISNVDQEDGGLYRCEARNDAGSVHHSEQVYIVGSPFIKPLGNITVQAGETLTIRCPVTGYPIHRITWSKGYYYNYSFSSIILHSHFLLSLGTRSLNEKEWGWSYSFLFQETNTCPTMYSLAFVPFPFFVWQYLTRK